MHIMLCCYQSVVTKYMFVKFLNFIYHNSGDPWILLCFEHISNDEAKPPNTKFFLDSLKCAFIVNFGYSVHIACELLPIIANEFFLIFSNFP